MYLSLVEYHTFGPTTILMQPVTVSFVIQHFHFSKEFKHLFFHLPFLCSDKHFAAFFILP